MQSNDIIMVNVTGTNGTTRNQKTISRRFSGAGLTLNDDGKIVTDSAEVLRNLPSGQVAPPPAFPVANLAAAQAQGLDGAKAVEEIMVAYSTAYASWQKSAGGGNEELQLAKAVLEYAKEFHGFREEDGDHFVMKLDNLDVTTAVLKDNRTLYTVAGTAVFG